MRRALTARQRYRLEHRVKRIERSMDRARGSCINLDWYNWMGLYMETMEELHGVDCWARIDRGALIV